MTSFRNSSATAIILSSSSPSLVPSDDKHIVGVSYRLEEPPEIQGVLGTYCVDKKESENLSSVSKMHLDQFLMEGARSLIEGKYDTPFARFAGFHVGRMVVPSSSKLMENANGEERYCGQAFLHYVDFMRLKAPLN